MISILIPLYNGIEFIDESVGSVLQQTFESWELLIGVNGHPPNSPVFIKAKEWEKENNKIRVFDFSDIQGKPNTLNELVKHSKYDYVAILDVDDVWYPTKLETQLPYLDNYDIIGSHCLYFGDKNKYISVPSGDLTYFNIKKTNPIINSSVLIRKNLAYWKDIMLEDYDLWIRLRKQGKLFYNCKEILVKHRLHEKSAFNFKNGQHVKELLKSHFG
jgi:teichuronic acid biosynthesis glycosyltransferase TuaG